MSILIKGMKMPKGCDECTCNSGIYCNAMPINFCGYTEDEDRPEWCPLVEVPPHGGLVDRDVLMTEIIDSDLDHLQRDDWKEVIQIVSDADVVIEAEGET